MKFFVMGHFLVEMTHFFGFLSKERAKIQSVQARRKSGAASGVCVSLCVGAFFRPDFLWPASAYWPLRLLFCQEESKATPL